MFRTERTAAVSHNSPRSRAEGGLASIRRGDRDKLQGEPAIIGLAEHAARLPGYVLRPVVEVVVAGAVDDEEVRLGRRRRTLEEA